MAGGLSVGSSFRWLWASYTISTYGSWLGYGAFSLIAITVLHEGPAAVAALSSVGLAAGAVLAVPLGPWLDARRRRPVMIAMDVTSWAALSTIPLAYALGLLTFVQLLLVTIVSASTKIVFTASGGAYLRTLVAPPHLLSANSRFESTTWGATIVGPPLGGAAIGLLGPVTTVIANAVSYLLSAAALIRIRDREPAPSPAASKRLDLGELAAGWRHLLVHPLLRPLFLNALAVNALILAPEPVLAVLMLGPLGFSAWQYGLAFAAPCVGGLVGSRLARPLAARFGAERVLRASGAARACWPLGLTFIQPGTAGLVLVIAVQFGLVTCISVYNPLMATRRVEHTPDDRLARVLTAWSISNNALIAGLTALWGVLAELAGARAAIALAGLLALVTPLLLPSRSALRHVCCAGQPDEPDNVTSRP